MTTWNYRVIDHGTYRALHEVHYDEKCRPKSYTSNPTRFCTDADDDADGVAQLLEMALEDIRHYPPLPVKVFTLPLEQRPIAPRRNRK